MAVQDLLFSLVRGIFYSAAFFVPNTLNLIFFGNAGCVELFQFLDEHKLPRGLLTRNTREAIDHMLGITKFKFDVELARDFLPVKPGTTQANFRSDDP